MIKPYLNHIQVSDAIGIELDTATIEIAASHIALPTREALIEVDLGYADSPLSTVFKGYINKISRKSVDVLTLSAKGLPLAEHHQLQSVVQRSWFDVTLKEIFSEIVGSAGFQPRIHQSLESKKVVRALQLTDTDIEFLQRLAKENGAVLKSDGTVIAMLPEDVQETASGKKLPTFASDRISSFRFQHFYRRGYKQVSAIWQDAEDGELKTETAGSGSPALTLKKIFSSKAAAQASARSRLARTEKTQQIRVDLPGDADFIAGADWVLSEMDDENLNGTYKLIKVNHRYQNGYRMSIVAVR